MKLISLIAVALLIVTQSYADAAVTGALSCLVTTADGMPAAGALVTATSESGETFQATADQGGRAVFPSLPVSTYTLTATVPGYATTSLTGVQVFSDQSATYHLIFQAAPPPTAAPPPPPPPPPSPTPRATGSPRAPLTSLLVGYNKLVPDHTAGAPYYGRYSYVLLRSSGARSRALIDALSSASSSVSGSPMVPTGIEETWRYNLFLMPVWPSSYRLANATTKEFMTHYNFTAAINLRQQYCNMASHSRYSLCVADSNGKLDDGPIIIVFSRPVSGIPYQQALPTALAVDLTGVPESQFPHVVGQLQKAMTIQIDHDSLLPLKWSDTVVASAILGLATALETLIGKSKVYVR
ncbi:MAG: carboxypeptidase-like regulatory domain-containing protein [Candidatus Cybelea sp.]